MRLSPILLTGCALSLSVSVTLVTPARAQEVAPGDPSAGGSAGATAAPEAAPRPLPDADAFYARVRARHASMFQKFIGTETTAIQRMERRSAKTGELRSRSKLKVIIRDHYYLPREVEVLEFWEDGEKQDPEDYTDRSGKEPRHPLLDANGPKEYAVELLGREEKLGHSCLVLRFIPRRKTTRHLAGRAWIDEESLDYVAVDVRPAKMPFGVQQISAQVSFRQEGDVMLSTGSVTRVLVHVPLVFPNNLMVIRDEVIEARGIPKI